MVGLSTDAYFNLGYWGGHYAVVLRSKICVDFRILRDKVVSFYFTSLDFFIWQCMIFRVGGQEVIISANKLC